MANIQDMAAAAAKEMLSVGPWWHKGQDPLEVLEGWEHDDGAWLAEMGVPSEERATYYAAKREAVRQLAPMYVNRHGSGL